MSGFALEHYAQLKQLLSQVYCYTFTHSLLGELVATMYWAKLSPEKSVCVLSQKICITVKFVFTCKDRNTKQCLNFHCKNDDAYTLSNLKFV